MQYGKLPWSLQTLTSVSTSLKVTADDNLTNFLAPAGSELPEYHHWMLVGFSWPVPKPRIDDPAQTPYSLISPETQSFVPKSIHPVFLSARKTTNSGEFKEKEFVIRGTGRSWDQWDAWKTQAQTACSAVSQEGYWGDTAKGTCRIITAMPLVEPPLDKHHQSCLNSVLPLGTPQLSFTIWIVLLRDRVLGESIQFGKSTPHLLLWLQMIIP